MIVKDMVVQYICNGCGKTGTYSVYGLHEKIEELYEKNIKRHVGNECMGCHKDKTVVTYCTGGIRCEKASAYLVEQGYQKKGYCKS